MPTPPATEPVVCTLLEKSYHFGLGGLANSLVRQGWRGTIYAGIRGPLPPWAQPLNASPGGQEYLISDGCRIRFIPIETTQHLTYYKPKFLLEVLQIHAPEASGAVYFDPDIVVKARWDFFCKWVGGRIALCEDLNWRFHRSHPLRREWAALLQPHGIVPPGQVDVYFNAGFVGIDRQHLAFLETWETILQAITPLTENCGKLSIGNRSFAFHMGDQDAMNIAVDLFHHTLSTLGPEGMDFIHGGYTMSHGVGSPKSWQKPFILSALQGKVPSQADKSFIANAAGPIRLYDGLTLGWKKIDLKIASALGRFIRRQ